jgi:hypothetical protein
MERPARAKRVAVIFILRFYLKRSGLIWKDEILELRSCSDAVMFTSASS